MTRQLRPVFRPPHPGVGLPRLCIFLTALLLPWSWSLAAPAERKPGGPAAAPAAEFAELQRELGAVRSSIPGDHQLNIRLEEQARLTQATAARLRQLDRDLVDFLVAHPEWASATGSGWYRAYRDANRLQTFRNFHPDPAAAVAHFKDQLARLDSVRGHFSITLQKQLLIDSTNLLLRQLHEHDPETVIDLVEFVEQLLQPDLMEVPVFRQTWLRNKAERGSMVIRMHPEPATEDWQLTMLEWWRDFLEDDVVWVRYKEIEVTRLAIALHTTGRSDEGLTWLRWLERRPEFDAWNSMSWLSHAFFASWIGLGDRDSGRRYFNRIQQLVDAGEVAPTNDLFRGVTSSYYSQLHKSDIQHQTDARNQAQSRFERSFPDARR